MCLPLFGSGCASRPVVLPAAECVPDIQVIERFKPLPAELLAPQPCPSVPDHGDMAHLLDWIENCAISARMANDQLQAIGALQ